MGPWNLDAWVPEIRDNSVLLTCEHHPDLVWNQKNLGYLGARSLFFFGWLVQKPDGRCTHGVRNTWETFHPETHAIARECDCPGTTLMVLYGPYRLELTRLGPPAPRPSRVKYPHRPIDWEEVDGLPDAATAQG
jgi:hypothetical protein